MNLVATDIKRIWQQESIRKQAIAKRFGDAAQSYDANAQVQKEVSQTGLDLLRQSVSKPANFALDIGCGTGFDTHHLLGLADRVTGADLSPGMIAWARANRGDPRLSWLVADAENLPLPSGEVDLLFSSMALQWLSDTQPIAQECFRIISKGGGGVIAVVLQESLFELHNSWLQIAKNPPVNQFFSANKWLIPFKNVGFKCNIKTQDFTTWHKDIFCRFAQYQGRWGRSCISGLKARLIEEK